MRLVEETRHEAAGIRPMLHTKKRMLAEGSMREHEVLTCHLASNSTNVLGDQDSAFLLNSAREIDNAVSKLRKGSPLGLLVSSKPSSPLNKASVQEQSHLEFELRALFSSLETGLLERGIEVRLLVLAALLKEHLLLLGPPGTAKSEVCRRLSRAFGGRYFERLLTRFTLPEELFGPLSLQELQHDRYVRQVQ
jgi:hypothetical protein